jgi:diguanylate cyclase (GGDEF)-like protein
MRFGVCKRMHVAARTFRAWPVWALPRGLAIFIVVLTVLYAAALGVAASAARVDPWDLLVFAVLLLCIATTVELTKRAGENAGVIKDVWGVWELPIAILLPPVFALVAPLIQITLAQYRIRRIPLHRRVFSAAAVGLSYGLASVGFHAVGPLVLGPGVLVDPGHYSHAQVAGWLVVVAGAGVLQWAANLALVLPAIKSSDPSLRIRDMIFDRERVQNDVAELSVAVLVTFGIATSLVTIVFALPLVTLLQRSMRHAQLLNASRMDSKTGLLNAGTWEREAGSEVARAVRTRSPLALILIDVDHFKIVNDLHGHLAGDRALRAIAHVFRIFLRDYDLAGRFGGEEFAVLLPQTSAADARHIAERVRLHIAETPIKISDDPAAVPVQITVSMGVAALGQIWERTTGSQLTDLLAGADRALYQAKNAGRNHVVMVTDTETVGTGTEPAGTGPQTAGTGPETVRAVADPGRLSRLSGRLARRAVPSRSVTRQAPEIPADRSWSG